MLLKGPLHLHIHRIPRRGRIVSFVLQCLLQQQQRARPGKICRLYARRLLAAEGVTTACRCDTGTHLQPHVGCQLSELLPLDGAAVVVIEHPEKARDVRFVGLVTDRTALRGRTARGRIYTVKPSMLEVRWQQLNSPKHHNQLLPTQLAIAVHIKDGEDFPEKSFVGLR
jgi:hypothetical protein